MKFETEIKENKVMNQGWRGKRSVHDRLQAMIDLTKSECNGVFVKTEFMDFLITAGMDAVEFAGAIDEVIEDIDKPKPKAKPKVDPVKWDLTSWPENPDVQLFKDWIAAKKRVKGSVTQSTMNKVGKELHKAALNGFTVNDCLATAESAAWRGFEAMWMKKPDTKVKRHSFMELAAGKHLDSLPTQPALAAPSYMDEFAALEHQHNGEG